uniref:DNA polymerase kappa n=1 Tax=Eptatretus burgeri TaxID=7764 RepID=A0A8C4N7Q0_EPTBU
METTEGTSGFLSRMALNDNKAGMEGLDKEKINKIILDASKGSRFYENELKKEEQVNQRIKKMLLQKEQLTKQDVERAQKQMDEMAADLERSRDLNRTIVHVDMDAFFAAVETRDRPEFTHRPMGVGSLSMLSTSNYVARRFGVRAAMPGFIAKRLCPELTILPLNFKKYEAVSKEVCEILAEYDPRFVRMSLDEAYLDITQHLKDRETWPKDRRTFASGSFLSRGCEKGTESAHLKVVEVKLEQEREGEMHDDTEPVQNYMKQPMPTAKGNVEESCMESNSEHITNEHESQVSLNCSPELFDDLPTQEESSCAELGHDSPLTLDCFSDPHQKAATASVTFGLSAHEVAKEIRFRIEQKTRLTASAGIAPNMLLAKVCSDRKKPNGQFDLLPNKAAIHQFMKELPIRKVSGIGKVTEKLLKALGITTCQDLFEQRAILAMLFSETSTRHFLAISLGIGATRLERNSERKSMSTERTFSEIRKPEELYSLCQKLCHDLAREVQEESLQGRTITLKIKNINFEVKTRAVSLPSAVSSEELLFAAARDLLKIEIESVHPQPLRLRLMGVRLSSFVDRMDQKKQQKSIDVFLNIGNKEECCSFLQQETRVPCPQRAGQTPLSFFQRVEAARKNEAAQHDVFTSTCTGQVPDGSLQSSTVQAKNNRGETKESGLVCPVCFQKQNCKGLYNFNMHIDHCLGLIYSEDVHSKHLSSPACYSGLINSVCCSNQSGNQNHILPSGKDLSTLEAHQEEGCCTFASQGNSTNKEVSESDTCCHSCQQTVSLCSCAGDESAGLLPDTIVSPESLADPTACEVPSMTCPVCHCSQLWVDLQAFNTHLDVCLNQGIISKLTSHECTDMCSPGVSGTSTKAGEKTSLRRNKLVEKPPMKKAKYSPSKNTIDKFFK